MDIDVATRSGSGVLLTHHEFDHTQARPDSGHSALFAISLLCPPLLPGWSSQMMMMHNVDSHIEAKVVQHDEEHERHVRRSVDRLELPNTHHCMISLGEKERESSSSGSLPHHNSEESPAQPSSRARCPSLQICYSSSDCARSAHLATSTRTPSGLPTSNTPSHIRIALLTYKVRLGPLAFPCTFLLRAPGSSPGSMCRLSSRTKLVCVLPP
jgi:hypothetical protein